MITVKFFASAAEIVQQRVSKMDIPNGQNVSGLLDTLCSAYPRLEMLRPSLRVAVNHEYAHNEDPVHDGDEVAIIPPVSGGIR
ncbi:MAG: molybdopterin converting factor subunit 1 [Planctomycetota bacterium]|nr:molybdopterin converting factor subunit 1 [Planctomycetota bacterium]MDA1138452.1 molybdopterin converting factor subunit 1 [Planctomycetota bacterium]